MKKATFFGLALFVSVFSVTSTASAQSSDPWNPGSYERVPVTTGEVLTLKNGQQLLIDARQSTLVSFKLDFAPVYGSGYFNFVEIPGEVIADEYTVWISKTPGGTPLADFPKQTVKWYGGPTNFYHSSIAVPRRKWPPLEHGIYYFNMAPISPTYFAISMGLRKFDGSITTGETISSSESSPACTTLTTDLEYDTDHPDVKLLQKFLNANGYKIASSGVGSAGNETTTFWDGTRTQVIKFQTDNGISPTGTVGPITRAKIKELSCGTTKPAVSTGSTTIESLLALIAQLRSQLDELTGTKSTATASTLTVAYPGKVLSNKSGSPIATIFWTYSDLTAKITLELHDKDGLVRTLATKMGNSGRYTWDYSSTVRDGEYTLVAKAYGTDGTLLSTDETNTFEVSKTKTTVGGSESGTGTSAKSTVAFTPAPIVRNSAGVPIVTSTYDLNANPFHRLIPATGGTKSVAIAFPATRGGYLMMTPGVNEYVRPDRTEVNISTKPNDFTPMQTACRQVNEISSDIMLQWVTQASDAPSWGACILEQGKIYYFNIRYVKADGTTACVQDTCGAYMDLPF